MIPETTTLPSGWWVSRLVYAWFRHLHNYTAYVALGLKERRYVDGDLIPAVMTADGSVQIGADALPMHAIRVQEGDTEIAGEIEGERRDWIDVVGVVVIAADDDPPGCGKIESIMSVIEAAALDREKHFELEQLLGGEAQFRIDGGPQARREGLAGRPTQWSWGYRLRLAGPFRQIIA